MMRHSAAHILASEPGRLTGIDVHIEARPAHARLDPFTRNRQTEGRTCLCVLLDAKCMWRRPIRRDQRARQ
jgi:hypothetical protein